MGFWTDAALFVLSAFAIIVTWAIIETRGKPTADDEYERLAEADDELRRREMADYYRIAAEINENQL